MLLKLFALVGEFVALENLKLALKCRSSAESKISRIADLPFSPGLHSIIEVTAVLVIIVGSKSLESRIVVASIFGIGLACLISQWFYFSVEENLSKFCSDG